MSRFLAFYDNLRCSVSIMSIVIVSGTGYDGHMLYLHVDAMILTLSVLFLYYAVELFQIFPVLHGDYLRQKDMFSYISYILTYVNSV